MPKPLRQIFATRPPISPTPTMPTVMAAISCALAPRARASSHGFILKKLLISKKFLDKINIAITEYSATDWALPPGMLATGMARSVAAAIGTRSNPVP